MNNKTKHTPGPWQINGDGDYVWVETKDGIRVAEIETFPMEYVEQERANGKLIVAAPELLDALKTIQYKLSHRKRFAEAFDEAGLVAEGIDKLISKAEGK